MMKNSKAGFTLAEVLTTLMVIGVVAAMTIPTLLNSTNDQQYKVAFKKATSILSQGTQLMVAKEEECVVSDSASLAKCFKENVLSGELVGVNGTSSNTATNNNVIKTSDGIAYSFLYDDTNVSDSDKAASRSLDSICGTLSTIDAASSIGDRYNGKGGHCLVVVDLNGLSKGSKAFSTNASATTPEDGDFTTNGVSDAADIGLAGDDQAVMMLLGDGIRPLYVGSGTSSDALSRGYEYMYGDVDPTSTGS